RTGPATSAAPAPRRSPHRAPTGGPAPTGTGQRTAHRGRPHHGARPGTRTHCPPAPDDLPAPTYPTAHDQTNYPAPPNNSLLSIIGPTSTHRIVQRSPRRPRTNSMSSDSVTWSSVVVTNATGRSPQRGWGTATTAASSTAGWAASTFSTSTDAMFSPPLTMMSLLRSV